MDSIAALPPGATLDIPQGAASQSLPPGAVLDPPPQQPLSWGDVGKRALQNAPSSAVHFAKDIAQPFMHPIDTAESLKNVGEGVLEKTGIMSGHEHEPYADAVGQFFANRYGSIDAFKHALAKDPVGVAGDLSMLLTGGGSALARAPGVAGKIGEVAATVGDIANPMSGVAKVAGATAGKLGKIGKVVASEGVPSTEDLRAAATEAYNHPSVKELSIKPSAIQDWKKTVQASLTDDAFDPDLAPRTFGVLNGIDNTVSKGTMTGSDLNNIRKKLTRASNVPDATERAAASHAIESLDRFSSDIPRDAVLRGDPQKVSQVLADARGNYAAAKRSETVDGKIENAELQAGAANSGQNIDNATRQKIKSILTSPSLRRGYSQEELAQMKRAVVGTFTGDTARYFANLFGKGGGLGALHAGVTGAIGGGLAAGPIGVAAGALAPTLGYGLAKLSNRITANEVSKLQNIIRSRSPLARQMEAPLKKWGEADVAHRASPTARTLARLTLASRNLSHNLADAGIQVMPDALMGSGGAQSQPGDQSGVTVSMMQPPQ